MTENKFYWDGLKMEDINGTTSTHPNINSKGYPNFPANFIQASNSNPLATQPSGFVSNTTFSNLPTPNDGYWFFTDDEDAAGETPPFKWDGTSIFAQTIGNQRIRVSHSEYTGGTGTVDIPDWCNAIKVYYISKKGTGGTAGDNVAADDYNVDAAHNRDEHKNNMTGGDHNKDDHNNTHIHHKYAAKSGGAGGVGGGGKIGWFVNYIKFTASTNNKLLYTVQSGQSGSNVKVVENNIVKGLITFVDGEDGTDGTDATFGTTETTHYDTGWNNNNSQHTHTVKGSEIGSPGDAGDAGTVTSSSISSGIYMNYNHVTNDSRRLKVYYFRHNTP
jgi:hypothetical protein